MAFARRLLVVQPRDSMRFRATDLGHKSAPPEGMASEGVAPRNVWVPEEIAVTFGCVCTPQSSIAIIGAMVIPSVA
ncbi:hypothetical protein [Roseicyclus mahoneyensis]|uniref:hypothetical protein n=1 Tax=Roseicyclus mahoneyensis TaxID=164332 RepID=UPI001B8652AF|nr:hypothetical protein [Roseicyclus mahoneyensis]